MTPRLHFNRFEEWPAAREALPAAKRAARLALASRERSGEREEPPADGPGDAGGGGDGAPGAPNEGEVSFTCLASDEIAEMNRRYLDRDRPTDVIAFPLSDPGSAPVGDVYLCPDVARESAAERDLPASEEIVRLVAHGALHVLGHEHPEGEGRESSEMYRLQEEIVGRALEGAAPEHEEGAEAEDRP